MRKSVIIVLLSLVCAVPSFAGTFDLGITIGTTAHSFESQYDTGRLRMSWGLTVGLADILEMDIQANSQLVPRFFGDTSVAVLFQGTLLGQRSTGTRVAGIGINSMLGVGMLFSRYNPDRIMGPTHLLLSITPITIGSPVTGRRERLLSFTLAYNVHTQAVSLIWDILKFDYYVVGTYRDYR